MINYNYNAILSQAAAQQNPAYRKHYYIRQGSTRKPRIGAAAMTMTAKDKALSVIFDQNDQMYKLLRGVGIPEAIVRYAVAMCFLESRQFTSNVSRVDNNYAGIKYAGQKWATMGLPAPSSEGKGNYAHYATHEDFAQDFKRVLSLQRPGNKIGRPIDATTGADFFNRLKANGYYGISAKQYMTRANAWLAKINKAKAWYLKAGKQFTSGNAPTTVNTGDWTSQDTKDVQWQKFKAWLHDNWLEAAGVTIAAVALLRR